MIFVCLLYTYECLYAWMYECMFACMTFVFVRLDDYQFTPIFWASSFTYFPSALLWVISHIGPRPTGLPASRVYNKKYNYESNNLIVNLNNELATYSNRQTYYDMSFPRESHGAARMIKNLFLSRFFVSLAHFLYKWKYITFYDLITDNLKKKSIYNEKWSIP